MEKQVKFLKQVVEIADFMFANPNKKGKDAVSLFCTKFHKSDRTIKKYIKQAKEYNTERIKKQEKVKDDTLVNEAKKSLKNAILTRNESLEILSRIAKGVARKVNDEIVVPTDSERTRAIQQLSKMQGWETINIDATTNGKDISFTGFNFLPYTPELDGQDKQETEDSIQLPDE